MRQEQGIVLGSWQWCSILDVDPADPSCPFDVILFNENGFITETSIANIALQVVEGDEKVWLTPPVLCGIFESLAP